MAAALEKCYLITPDFLGKKEIFLQQLECSLNNGIKLVQLRSKQLSLPEYKNLAKDVLKIVHLHGAKVIFNGPVTLLDELPGDGIHLTSSQLMALAERPVGEQYLLSVACHNASQVHHGARIGADLMTISPVLATPSSPQGKPLGWDSFSNLARATKVTVFALGGLSQKDLPQASQKGAYGIAAKRAFWNLQKPLVD